MVEEITTIHYCTNCTYCWEKKDKISESNPIIRPPKKCPKCKQVLQSYRTENALRRSMKE